METACSSETMVHNDQAIQRHILKEMDSQSHGKESM